MSDVFKELGYIFTKKEKFYLFFLLVIIVISSAMELLGVSAFLPFIQVTMNPETIQSNAKLRFFYELLDFRNSTDFLAAIALVIIFIFVFKNIFLAWERNEIYKFSFGLQKRISVRLLTAYMSEPYTFHLNKNISEMQRALLDDTDLVAKLIIHGLELITEVLVCVILGVYLFIVSKSITVIVVGILLILVVGFTALAKKISGTLGKENQKNRSLIYQWMNQALGGIKEVKVLGREQFFLNRYEKTFRVYVRDVRIARLAGELPHFFVEAACMTGLLSAIILKMYFGQKSFQAFIPQMAVFAVAAFRMLPSVGKINEHVSNVLYDIPSLNIIYRDLLDVEQAPEKPKPCDPSWKLQNGVRVEHVSFHYPESAENILDDASLEIPRGKTVALVGVSGAGKTTMADLILGLLTPQMGHIFADDLDIVKNVRTWQREIGYIPQVIYLSDDTIRNNIAFGIEASEIDEDAVVRAAKEAQLYDFIQTLPEGLDTRVGDRGVRISGGQRQRIGIARALYHDPEVLILDEATSALDNETETAVMESVDALHGQKTMLIIAHRLSTIRNADIVYEIGGGKAALRDKEEVLSGQKD